MREQDRVRPRTPVFSGTPEEWRYLVDAWGRDAVRLMRLADDGAQYSAALAVRLAHKGHLIDTSAGG